MDSKCGLEADNSQMNDDFKPESIGQHSNDDNNNNDNVQMQSSALASCQVPRQQAPVPGRLEHWQ